MLGKPSVQEIQPCKSSVGINAVQLVVSQSSEICRRVQSSQATKVTNMKVFAGLVLLVSTSVAFPQAKSGCGTNERGVARKPGDNWQEQCNRCRCLESGVPGCTKKFCGSIPGLCKWSYEFELPNLLFCAQLHLPARPAKTVMAT